MNWSSGKDSSMALQQLIEEGRKPDLLLTVINKETQRIGMHGLSRELLLRQAKAIGIPLQIIELSTSTDHAAYEEMMLNTCNDLKARGFTTAVFGDIFLEDLKKHREEQLKKAGLEAYFPLWKRDTTSLIEEFVQKGFRSCIVAAHANYFEEEFVGSEIDGSFLNRLPNEVDPCGENGEFHSFCFDGPIFDEPVPFEKGKKLIRTYPNPNRKEESKEIAFHFIDLL